jgi:cytochrome c-type biogenesis protein CcmH/NrfG
MTDNDPRTRLGLTSEASDEDVESAHRDVVSFLEGAPEGLHRWAQSEIATVEGAHAALTRPGRGRRSRRRSSLGRIAVAIAVLAASAGVVVGVYSLGGGKDEASSQQGGAPEGQALSPGDEVRVAQLMNKLKADPKDIPTLLQIGNIFFQAGDYNSAGGWMRQVVTLDSGNVQARLALGASEFNIKDVADARRDWLRVIAVDPKNVEAYYDLGFLYLSKNPPDMAEAKRVWRKVVALAPPGSAVAKTVATHLKGLEKTASATATPPGGKG